MGEWVRAWAAIEACETHSQCRSEPDAFASCRTTSTSPSVTGVCEQVHYAEPAAEGQSCGRTQSGEFTVSVIPCGAATSCSSGTCRGPLALGAACGGPGDLCDGAAFRRPEGMGGYACEVTDYAGAGEACSDGFGAPACDPFAEPRLFCELSDTCGVSGRPAGAACRLGGGYECAAGLNCDIVAHVCVAPKPAGQACRSNRECQSGLCLLAGIASEWTCSATYCGG